MATRRSRLQLLASPRSEENITDSSRSDLEKKRRRTAVERRISIKGNGPSPRIHRITKNTAEQENRDAYSRGNWPFTVYVAVAAAAAAAALLMHRLNAMRAACDVRNGL
jgi:hypothetical protein